MFWIAVVQKIKAHEFFSPEDPSINEITQKNRTTGQVTDDSMTYEICLLDT
jgi:hypothetical protein